MTYVVWHLLRRFMVVTKFSDYFPPRKHISHLKGVSSRTINSLRTAAIAMNVTEHPAMILLFM